MPTIEDQIAALKRSWSKAFEHALANPAAWQPHLPNSSISALDEALRTVEYWLERSRAPAGFSPGYHLAKSTASMFLPQLLSACQNLEAGQYNHLPSFANALTNVLAAVHTMAVYSDKETSLLNADLAAQLSQSLALLNTAQRELTEKKRLLEEVETLAAAIELTHDTVSERAESAEIAAKRIADVEQQADGHLKETSEILLEVKAHDDELDELLDSSKKLNAKLTLMTDELDKLQSKCKEQERVIDSILPKGASAGLAAAFSTRVLQLNIAKWLWMGVFAVSIIGLSVFAWRLSLNPSMDIKDLWLNIAARIPLAAPLVWLGWFSAIQYGNTIRVQEDYAFKEATSKAFQGYRDHMEHLSSVDLDEAQTALKLLSAKTIEILGHEPLRIYSKTEHDATPAHGFFNIFAGGSKSGVQNKS